MCVRVWCGWVGGCWVWRLHSTATGFPRSDTALASRCGGHAPGASDALDTTPRHTPHHAATPTTTPRRPTRNQQEREAELASLRRRAHMVTDGFNSLEDVTCNFTEGAMYSFPQVRRVGGWGGWVGGRVEVWCFAARFREGV